MADSEFTTQELASELWRLVPEFDDYEVSSLGRVRRATAGRLVPKGYLLSTASRKTRYLSVVLTGSRRVTKNVHRLVALAFLGEPPANRPHVNHIDGNPYNNRLSNLEYCSPSENKRHSIDVLGHRVDGEHSAVARLTASQVLAIHDALMAATPPSQIMADFNISETQLYRIKHRESWDSILKELPSDYPPPLRAGRGSRIASSKLTEADVRIVKNLIDQGQTNAQIAKCFGLKSPNTIQWIRSGKSWQHVT